MKGGSFITPRVRIREGTRARGASTLRCPRRLRQGRSVRIKHTHHATNYISRGRPSCSPSSEGSAINTITRHRRSAKQQYQRLPQHVGDFPSKKPSPRETSYRPPSPRVRNVQQIMVLVERGVIVLLLVALHSHRAPPPPRQLLSRRPPREPGLLRLRLHPARPADGREGGGPAPRGEGLALRLDVARVRAADGQAGQLHPGEAGPVQLADAVVVAAAACRVVSVRFVRRDKTRTRNKNTGRVCGRACGRRHGRGEVSRKRKKGEVNQRILGTNSRACRSDASPSWLFGVRYLLQQRWFGSFGMDDVPTSCA